MRPHPHADPTRPPGQASGLPPRAEGSWRRRTEGSPSPNPNPAPSHLQAYPPQAYAQQGYVPTGANQQPLGPSQPRHYSPAPTHPMAQPPQTLWRAAPPLDPSVVTSISQQQRERQMDPWAGREVNVAEDPFADIPGSRLPSGPANWRANRQAEQQQGSHSKNKRTKPSHDARVPQDVRLSLPAGGMSSLPPPSVEARPIAPGTHLPSWIEGEIARDAKRRNPPPPAPRGKGGRGRNARKAPPPPPPELDPPVRDVPYLCLHVHDISALASHPSSGMRQWGEKPKSFLTTYLNNTYGRRSEATWERRGPLDGTVHRATLEADPQLGLFGVGEGYSKKDAERAAAFDACCLLEARGLTGRGRGRIRGYETPGVGGGSQGGAATGTAAAATPGSKASGQLARGQVIDFFADHGQHCAPEVTSGKRGFRALYSLPQPAIAVEGLGRSRKAAEMAGAELFKLAAEAQLGAVAWSTKPLWTLEVGRNWLVYYERHRQNCPAARVESFKERGGWAAHVWVDTDQQPGGSALGKASQKEATDEAWMRAALLLRGRQPHLWDRYIARKTGKAVEGGAGGSGQNDKATRVGLLEEGVDGEVAEARLRHLLQGLRDVYGDEIPQGEEGGEGEGEGGDGDAPGNYSLVVSSDEEEEEGAGAGADPKEGRRWVRHDRSADQPASQPSAQDASRNALLQAQWARYVASPTGARMIADRERLPMVQHAGELMEAIHTSPVVVVVGQTGCGKTTQVPQLILEEAVASGNPTACRIICTQPRRLAAIAVAERVAKERGERVGAPGSIGYTVRFDARPPVPTGGTVQYCTTGVLLRRLHGAEGLDGVSHVVVDEVHERDMGVDFLLVVLRRLLAQRVKEGQEPVKLILMSATVETGLFASYFASVCQGRPAPIVRVPGRTFPVSRHLLGELISDYRSRYEARELDRWLRAPDTVKYLDRELRLPPPAHPVGGTSNSASSSRTHTPHLSRSGTPLQYSEDDTFEGLDDDDEDDEEDGRSVASDDSSIPQPILPDIRATGGHSKVSRWMRLSPQEVREEAEVPVSLVALTVAHIIRQVEERLAHRARHIDDPSSVPPPTGDEPEEGAILVFLPGWEEMTKVHSHLTTGRPLGLDMSQEAIYHVHMLHSSIPAKTQHLVFDRVPKGEWKIILATNIAETSITIDDVVWVVDSGKIREKRYDPATRISHLTTCWVSESSARQRAGRAGRVRPGHYYGCMSEGRYAELEAYGTPEMVRSDLQEICLHIRALELPGGSAAALLAEALEPPDPAAVAAALDNLRALRALDEDERLTPLGRVLATLPVEPTLGRMVLLGVVMRALDPALTLAAAMAGKDPFAGPAWKRAECDAARSRWAGGTRSDLLAISRVYEPWVEGIHAQGGGRFHGGASGAGGRPPPGEVMRFCEAEALGWQSMQAIDRTKAQLLDVLRRAGVLRAALRHFPPDPPGTQRRKGLYLGPPELNSNSHSLTLLRSLALSGVYPNVAVQRGDGRRKKEAGCVTRHARWALIHPSSVNSRRQLERADIDHPPPRGALPDGSHGSVYVFSEMVQSAPVAAKGGAGGGGGGMSILRQTTRVSPATALLFGGSVEEEMTPHGSLELLMDGWLRISGASPAYTYASPATAARSSVLLALAAQVKWQMERAFELTFADMMRPPPAASKKGSHSETAPATKSLFSQGHLVKEFIGALESLDIEGERRR